MIKMRTLGAVTLSRSASAGLAYLATLYLLSRLSPSEYGAYYFWFALTSLLVGAAAAGLNNSYVFGFKAAPDQYSLTQSYLVVKGVVAVAIVASAAVIAWVGGRPLIAVVGVAAGAIAILDAHLSVLQADKRFRAFALFMPIRNLVILVALVYAIEIQHDLDAKSLMEAYAVGCLGLAIIVAAPRLGARFKMADMRYLWSKAGDFWIYEIGILISIRVDVMVMEWSRSRGLVTAVAMGEYTAAISMLAVLPVVSSAVSSVLLPTYSEITSEHEAAERRMFRTAILGALVLTIAYGLFATLALGWVAPDYAGAIWLLAFLLVGSLIGFVANLYRMRVLAVAGHTDLRKIAVKQGAISLGLAACLIPLFGTSGAVASFVIGRIISLGLYMKGYAAARDTFRRSPS